MVVAPAGSVTMRSSNSSTMFIHVPHQTDINQWTIAVGSKNRLHCLDAVKALLLKRKATNLAWSLCSIIAVGCFWFWTYSAPRSLPRMLDRESACHLWRCPYSPYWGDRIANHQKVAQRYLDPGNVTVPCTELFGKGPVTRGPTGAQTTKLLSMEGPWGACRDAPKVVSAKPENLKRKPWFWPLNCPIQFWDSKLSNFCWIYLTCGLHGRPCECSLSLTFWWYLGNTFQYLSILHLW